VQHLGVDYSITSVILVYMKTAISLPDPLFRSADRLAKHLKVSRSALYATAIADYVAQHQRKSVTERLNEVYGEGGEDSTLDPVVAGLQWHSLPKDEW
jgi:hypothetical protein